MTNYLRIPQAGTGLGTAITRAHGHNGDNLTALLDSPHLERLKEKDLEVLPLTAATK